MAEYKQYQSPSNSHLHTTSHTQSRYSHLSRSKKDAPHRVSLTNPNHNLSCVFTMSPQIDPCSYLKRKNHLTHKKKGLTQAGRKDDNRSLMVTPFQERKIQQSQKSSKILSRMLQSCGKKKALQNSQGQWLIVKEMSNSWQGRPIVQEQRIKQILLKQEGNCVADKQEEENIRETGISCQSQKPALFRNIKESQAINEKQLMKSWVFPCSSGEAAENRGKYSRQKHKKMTLKELCKYKGLHEMKRAPNDHSIIHQARELCKQKMKELTLYKQSKQRKIVLTQPTQLQRRVASKSTIHSKTFQKTGTLKKYVYESAASALNIKPCHLDESRSVHLRAEGLYSSLSQSKIDVRKSSKVKLTARYRSNKSLGKPKQIEDALSKDLSGWQYVNDFSERQAVF